MTSLLALTVATGPVRADTPATWSDPEMPGALWILLVLGGIPLLMFAVITAAVYLPAMIRGERVAPGVPETEDVWLGGPRKTAGELAPPDTAESQAGGASVRW